MLGNNHFIQQMLENDKEKTNRILAYGMDRRIVGTPFIEPTTEPTTEPTQEIDLTNVDVKSDFWRWFIIGGSVLMAYYILKKV